MKKIILSTCLYIGSSMLLAQDNSTCYQKYVKVFEVRGANEISDGLHENVVITIRKGSFADCFVGRAKVKDGYIDTKTLQMSFIDETFEPFRRSYKYDEPVTIVNGISKTLVTNDEELVNILFVDAIKPKKKAYKRAPEPEFEL
ncbi:MAG: hypothetical protein CMO34_04120 [Verrucomicrobia bacterium]|nr:hypothetical protein [Verrucomicrobiota bacterium]